jgi:hypothetical protein
MRHTGAETALRGEKSLKVKSSQCLIKLHDMKIYGVVDVWVHTTSALDENKWSASRSGRFIPEKRTPSSQRIGGRLDLEQQGGTSPGLPGIESRLYSSWPNDYTDRFLTYWTTMSNLNMSKNNWQIGYVCSCGNNTEASKHGVFLGGRSACFTDFAWKCLENPTKHQNLVSKPKSEPDMFRIRKSANY